MPNPDRGASTIVVLLLFASLTLSAQSSDRAQAESQARRANERLLTLQREADTLATQQRTLLIELRRLEVERNLRTEQLRDIEADARSTSLELVNTTNQIDALESENAASLPVLEARAVELYKLGSAGYMRLLFNVSNLRDFGRAYRMVTAMAALDRRRADEHQANLVRLRAAQRSLETRRAELAKLQLSAQAARAAADRATAARAQLIAQIDQRRDMTAELASELQGAQVKLQQTLSAIKAGTPRPATEGSALPIRPFKGDLDWPVTGRMLTPFGNRAGTATMASTPGGVQFSAEEGSTVRAVHDGTVAYTGPFTGYGNLVIIDHGAETFSLYGQLDTLQVERGAKVERGATLGTAGRVLAGIPGMYFEMRVDGKPVDPLEWLRKRPQ